MLLSEQIVHYNGIYNKWSLLLRQMKMKLIWLRCDLCFAYEDLNILTELQISMQFRNKRDFKMRVPRLPVASSFPRCGTVERDSNREHMYMELAFGRILSEFWFKVSIPGVERSQEIICFLL